MRAIKDKCKPGSVARLAVIWISVSLAAAGCGPAAITSTGQDDGGKSQTPDIAAKKDSKGRIVLMGQRPEWYTAPEALRIAENMVLFQHKSGGWPKDIDMTVQLTEEQLAALRENPQYAARLGGGYATLDNGATFAQMRYLARVYTACRAAGMDAERPEAFKAAVIKGLDYLLAAQYANGGWPQVPGGGGYHKHITFNDGVMANALDLLQDVAEQSRDFAFIDEQRRENAAAAVRRGIDCVLKCQVVLDGKRTVWCQQHDEKDFTPRGARPFEPAALTGAESVGVVRFLMRIDNPSEEIVEAVQSAVAWFAGPAKLTGIRQVTRDDKSKPRGWDKIVVEDPSAPPLWARFYYIGDLGGARWKLMDPDIKINQPIFGDRDGKVYSSLEKISHERRTGYSWFGTYPARLLAEDYPAWQKKWAPDSNVLSPADADKPQP
ncbi:MAG: pectate lyase [Planctomycetota bacterium]|jgi:PelA/Pel-15E family pectate lyase